MQVDDIVSLAKDLAFSPEESSTKVLNYVNLIYDDLTSAITTKIDAEFFYEEFTIDLVAWTNTYTLPTSTSSENWLKDILWVSIKYDSSWSYSRATEKWIAQLSEAVSYYEINQDKSEPFYINSVNKIRIYPTPTADVSLWLKIYWTAELFSLSSWWSEDTIQLPKNYHKILAIWAAYNIFFSQWKSTEWQIKKNDYDSAKAEMISNLAKLKSKNFDTSTIINMARNECWATYLVVSNSQATDFMNRTYENIYNTIVNDVNQKYFWDTWTADINWWQNEYALQKQDASNDWQYKIQSISIDYGNWYQKAKYCDPDWLTYDSSYYETNQDTNNPFFYIANWSIFIFPKPTQGVSNWLKLTWIKLFQKLSEDAKYSDTFNWYSELQLKASLIVVWMKQFIYGAMQKFNEKNDAKIDYQQWLQGLIKDLSQRFDWSTYETTPDLSMFE